MKIAILGPAPPFRGGISLFALKLARAWQEQGHEPAFFNFRSQYPRLLFPGKDQTDKALNKIEFPNFRILTPWLPLSWWRTAKAIKNYEAELIVVSWFLPFFAPTYGFILRCLPKITKVILAHNVAAHEKWFFAGFLRRFAFAPATRIVVLSQSCYHELKHLLPFSISRRGVLGFHPVNDLLKQDSGIAKLPILLFFGLIKPYKGLDVLLAALPLVLQKFPQAKLIIAGEVYGDSSGYLSQIRQLGIANSVQAHFRYISEPEITQFFNQASLCILPYKSASQSGVIATAYSLGIPVLASNVGGLGEYVIEGVTGYLVPPNDPNKLAAAIIRHLADNPDFSTGIKAFWQKYSWANLADLIIKP